jgi:hypothetical protein
MWKWSSVYSFVETPANPAPHVVIFCKISVRPPSSLTMLGAREAANCAAPIPMFPFESCTHYSPSHSQEQARDYIYKSASSSSGRGIWAAFSISCRYCSRTAWSTVTSGGARAGAATKSKDWLPTSFLASQRKGFSKL